MSYTLFGNQVIKTMDVGIMTYLRIKPVLFQLKSFKNKVRFSNDIALLEITKYMYYVDTQNTLKVCFTQIYTFRNKLYISVMLK